MSRDAVPVEREADVYFLVIPRELAMRVPEGVKFVPELTEDGVLFRAIVPRIMRQPEPVPSWSVPEEEWADLYGIDGYRRGVRCTSTCEGLQCMNKAGHDGTHRHTASSDGRSMGWNDAGKRTY